VNELSFSVANLNYRLVEDGRHFEYRMMLRTPDPDTIRNLSEILVRTPTVLEFRISPTGD
jgi:putative Mg2+ transporter-C (MgtC) family protein